MRESAIKTGHMFKDRYLMLSLLGKGGMGNVYLAKDLRLNGKSWAIKEVKTAMAQQRFLDEANMLSSLDHPSLPKIVDYYPPNTDGYSYLVMDYIKGKTLQELFIEKKKNLSLKQIVQFAIQIAELLTVLHEYQPQPIIFRDLKPSNIMLDGEQLRLIDFGTARWYQQGRKEDAVQLGTIGFAAPEQFEGKQSDERTDVYALGAMLYYFLTNGKYIQGEEQTKHKLNQSIPFFSQKQQLIRIVQKATAYHLDARYQSAQEIKKELQLCIAQHDPEHKATPLSPF